VSLVCLGCAPGASPATSLQRSVAPGVEAGRGAIVETGQSPDAGVTNGGEASYAAELGSFFAQRLPLPSTLSADEAKKLCVVYDISLSKRMVVWHIKSDPVKSSGNDAFDHAARDMLLSLLDAKTPLPPPPTEVDDHYRGRRIAIAIVGGPGASSNCAP